VYLCCVLFTTKIGFAVGVYISNGVAKHNIISMRSFRDEGKYGCSYVSLKLSKVDLLDDDGFASFVRSCNDDHPDKNECNPLTTCYLLSFEKKNACNLFGISNLCFPESCDIYSGKKQRKNKHISTCSYVKFVSLFLTEQYLVMSQLLIFILNFRGICFVKKVE